MSQPPEPDAVAPPLDQRPTRGGGLLEGWLSRKRIAMAERLIPPGLRSGAILDFGCGSFPLFLNHTRFARRVGLDRAVAGHAVPGVELIDFDIDREDRLPFRDGEFAVVSALAVFEHIRRDRLLLLLAEFDRVLAPGGVVVMTTPSHRAEPVLKVMSKLGLVSAEEIEEHQDHYSPAALRRVLSETPLATYDTKVGTFEFGMNLWVTASKPRG
jgi:SAM-dependent methyltransferase